MPSASSEALHAFLSGAEGASEITECLLPFNVKPSALTRHEREAVHEVFNDVAHAPTTEITDSDRADIRFGVAGSLRECLAEADSEDAVVTCFLDYDAATTARVSRPGPRRCSRVVVV